MGQGSNVRLEKYKMDEHFLRRVEEQGKNSLNPVMVGQESTWVIMMLSPFDI